MLKYRGKYRIFMPLDNRGNVTTNPDDTYLKCKNKTEIYRYSENQLAIYFKTIKSSQSVLSQLSELDVQIKKFVEGDFESVYLFDESDIDKVTSILKPQTKGSKISPKSKRTVKIIKKEKRK